MLIYSKIHYISLLRNVIVTDVKNDLGFIYIHRDTYDEAVTISTNYFCEDVIKALGRDNNVDIINELKDLVDDKLQVLLGFIVLLNDDIFSGLETLEEKIELAVGAIHRMSMTLDLVGVLNVPVEMRKKFNFSNSIKDEYRLSWDKFFKESLTYDEIVAALKENTLVPQVQYVIPINGVIPGQLQNQEVIVSNKVDDYGIEDNSEELKELENDITGGDPNFDWAAYYENLANTYDLKKDIEPSTIKETTATEEVIVSKDNSESSDSGKVVKRRVSII